MAFRPNVIFMVLAVCAWTAPACFACSCIPVTSAASARDRADAVFLGKVKDVEKQGGETNSWNEQRVIVTLTVERVWKGPVTREFVLPSVMNGASCDGYSWKEGERLLVFATKEQPEANALLDQTKMQRSVYRVSLCGGTTRIDSDHHPFLLELGPGKSPA